MIFGLRRRSNSAGEATATVGKPAAGAAPAGIGVALTGAAARVGVVLPAGMDGGTQAARWLVRRSRAGVRYVANAASIAFRVLIVSLFASNSTSLQRTISPWAMSCFSLRRCARPIGRAPAFRLAAAGTSLPHTV
ncbi:putative membrane protein [Bradyrhizobium sp. USDA 4470]